MTQEKKKRMTYDERKAMEAQKRRLPTPSAASRAHILEATSLRIAGFL